MSTVTPAAPATSPARRDLIRAWVSFGLLVPGYLGLIASIYWADSDNGPLVASVMPAVMLALLAVFATGAVWFGVQAKRLGRRAGLVPAILAGLGVVYFLVGGIVMLVQWLT